MLDRRKRVLVNTYEVATHKALQEAAFRSNARVYPKLGVATALDIVDSCLTDEEYSYTLKAHFDFVVTREDDEAAFAVEFDGPRHSLDVKTIHRDLLKNSICDKLGMPLLRIDATYLRQVGRFSVLGWLVEVWFLNEGFCTAQARGEIPPDEIFSPYFILGLGYLAGSQIVEIDAYAFAKAAREMDPQSFAAFAARLRPITPYDPFTPARALMDRCRQAGMCQYPPEILRAADPQRYWVTVALLKVSDGRAIIGVGRVRPFDFPPVDPFELSEELAMFDAAEKLKLYRKGKLNPAGAEEVAAWRERFAKWQAYK